jgi:hypothetical protein
MKIEIPNFWKVIEYDYHGFQDLKRAYRTIKLETDYEECGFNGMYVAIFWLKSTNKPVEEIEKLREEIRNSEDNFFTPEFS